MAGTSGCSPSEVLRPDDPTAREAYEPGWQCRDVGSYGEPLVVDLRAHERANIEEAMHDGVAVVAYDCERLRLLPGCRVDGSYGFIAVSRKEDVVQLADATELRANLPGGGLVDSVSAELERGQSLDVAMILVGKRRTTVGSVSGADLKAQPACAGATHFVRGAHIGAFALDIGTRGNLRASASVFAEAKSSSTKLSQFRDGQPETCRQLASDEPSPTCNAVLRLELIGLDHTPQDPSRAAVPCPEGLALVAEKCVPPEPEQPHLCRYGDFDDCTEQCAKGDAGSCYNLASGYFFAEGAAKDVVQAQRFYAQACDGGSSAACSMLGLLYLSGPKPFDNERHRAPALLARGCDAGNAQGCSTLGRLYLTGDLVDKDFGRGAALYGRACAAGEPLACSHLGLAYLGRTDFSFDAQELAAPPLAGVGVQPDATRAASLMERGCDGGVAQACFAAAMLYSGAYGVTPDARKSDRFKRLTCLRSDEICANMRVHGLIDFETPRIGLEIADASPATLRANQLSAGVAVLGVAAGSAAERSGLRQGDVIVSLAEEPVTSAKALQQTLATTKADAVLKLGFRRHGKPMTVNITLVPAPAPAPAKP